MHASTAAKDSPDDSGNGIVVVAGGAGFLGGHLCRRLLQQGHRVLALDNLSGGSLFNLADLIGDAAFAFQRHDVARPYETPARAIYNLACCASPPGNAANSEQTLRTCMGGAASALQLARRSGARVLQASAGSVYGQPDVHPQPETYHGSVDTAGARACRQEGLRVAESLCFAARRAHGTSVRVARVFSTYGPRMPVSEDRVVSTLIVQALCNRPLTIHGNGLQRRAFCYVDDVIDGLLQLMDSDDEMLGPVNLGSPCDIPVLELAERILALTGSGSRIAHQPMPADSARRRCPDITRARESLGWTPRIALDEGLLRTIDWFEATLRASDLRAGARQHAHA